MQNGIPCFLLDLFLALLPGFRFQQLLLQTCSSCLLYTSTDFLLGETNIPDRKNYDIAELGLSVEAAKNLYTARVNAEVVNLLLENARFAELTYRISQYFDDTLSLIHI